MSDLPEKTSKLSLNPQAAEWKPSAAAREFVPSFSAPKPTAPADSPATGAPAAPRVLKLASSNPAPSPPANPSPSSAAETPKPAPKPAAKPAPKPVAENKATAPPSSGSNITAAKSAVEEDIENVDEEVKEELFGKLDGKQHLNVVFMGHVDAGKSTMGGNILYLTGMVDKRTMDKYEREAKEAGRESWYLSWALDTNDEERAKGKTVECGRAHFETDKRRYTILDAPGHKNYVPSMISGASQADVGVLVISARKGEFETGFERGGQTREHAMLSKTSGINKMVIAINKMDDPTVQWDKARYDEIIEKLTPYLKSTGYNPKKDIKFMPVSGYTGANIKERAPECTWYKEESLLEYLDNMEITDRKIHAPLMIPVAEKFKDMGTIIVGKIESGAVKKGQSLVLMPNKAKVEVTAIFNETDDEVDYAVCGDNVRVRISGVKEDEVSSGFVLCDTKNPVRTATQFEARLVILDHKNIICAGYTAVLHIHTAVEEITLNALLHLIDKKTGRKLKKPPQFVKQGQQVNVRIETAKPVCIETFNDYAQLGRFTVRDEGKTIAIGRVSKVLDEE